MKGCVLASRRRSSLTIIGCNEVAQSGGAGVTEYFVDLETGGGLLTIFFEPQGIPDKLEILHNGVKKATSGMTTANGGPFDNTTGDPNPPTTTEANTIDQYIGSSKGTVPTRQATYQSETGSALTLISPYQQIIWWQYTSGDFTTNNKAMIRVCGAGGTLWSFKRQC